MKKYVLRNEELGYHMYCPTYENKEDAERDASSKCRRHSVIEADERKITPCKPHRLCLSCFLCARCASTVDARMDFVKAHGFRTIEECKKELRKSKL